MWSRKMKRRKINHALLTTFIGPYLILYYVACNTASAQTKVGTYPLDIDNLSNVTATQAPFVQNQTWEINHDRTSDEIFDDLGKDMMREFHGSSAAAMADGAKKIENTAEALEDGTYVTKTKIVENTKDSSGAIVQKKTVITVKKIPFEVAEERRRQKKEWKLQKLKIMPKLGQGKEVKQQEAVRVDKPPVPKDKKCQGEQDKPKKDGKSSKGSGAKSEKRCKPSSGKDSSKEKEKGSVKKKGNQQESGDKKKKKM